MGEVIVYCEICNKQFIPYRSYHKVCSNLCRKIKTERDHYGYEVKKIVTKKCKNCDSEFSSNNKKKVYCCTECAIEYNKKHRIKKETRLCICEVCGSAFKTTHHAKKYCCNDCYKEAKRRREYV